MTTHHTDWKTQAEKRFITWALAREDDWWEDGYGTFSIWDVRIMLDFFVQERLRLLEEVEQLIGEIEKLDYVKIPMDGKIRKYIYRSYLMKWVRDALQTMKKGEK